MATDKKAQSALADATGSGAPDSATAPKIDKLAKKAAVTGKTVGKASLKVAKPLARSLQKQSPDTLAKMLLAAAAPRLIDGVLRFAIRNPKTLLIGAALAAFAISRLDDESTTA